MYPYQYSYMDEIKLTELKCKKCGHTWKPRQEEVRQCPKCKSAWWDEDNSIVDEKKEAKADLAKDDPDTKMEE